MDIINYIKQNNLNINISDTLVLDEQNNYLFTLIDIMM